MIVQTVPDLRKQPRCCRKFDLVGCCSELVVELQAKYIVSVVFRIRGLLPRNSRPDLHNRANYNRCTWTSSDKLQNIYMLVTNTAFKTNLGLSSRITMQTSVLSRVSFKSIRDWWTLTESIQVQYLTENNQCSYSISNTILRVPRLNSYRGLQTRSSAGAGMGEYY